MLNVRSKPLRVDGTLACVLEDGEEVAGSSGGDEQMPDEMTLLVVFTSIIEHIGVGGLHQQNLSQLNDLMTFLPKHSSNFGWHVVIQRGLHSPALICRAMRASISTL